ncbi:MULTISPECIES: prephenate dehydrogenase [Enorma]|uniref:prephenate dehydrogenase n=1 Tax=Enorma TaxID=1472762 RepID=UPI00034CD038|nr:MULTISPECIES: prephenate dehydrogenase/arogenate dehydrogenase family protein [Enorma]
MTAVQDASMGGERAAQPTIGIVGLGLIGGSFARAYAAAGARVIACDTDEDTMDAAMIETVEAVLDDEEIPACDLIILAAYPDACIEWLEEHAEALGAASDTERGTGPVVIDTAGVKAAVCARAFDLAREHGFAFVGAHPMAGTEHSGFAHARANLFEGAPMVLVPPALDDTGRLLLLDRVHTLLAPVGFGTFSVTTPEEHDEVIAYTSQLAHVVSNAYVKSPTAREHHGFSAGSYRDLTRVAHLNPAMWAELMCDDAENLSREIGRIIDALGAYRDALDAGDRERLRALLAEGDRIKRALDDERDS